MLNFILFEDVAGPTEDPTDVSRSLVDKTWRA